MDQRSVTIVPAGGVPASGHWEYRIAEHRIGEHRERALVLGCAKEVNHAACEGVCDRHYSIPVFSTRSWQAMCFPEQQAQQSFADVDYPAYPYPGARPEFSFVQRDGVGHPLRPDATAPSGWRVRTDALTEPCLDEWLAEHGAAPFHDRRPVLAYGSNACPGKITWLRKNLGLTGPAVVLRARCTGLSAVWAAGLRVRDGQRPAVLAAAPGIVEHHAVWFATAEQRRVLDECEGRGVRYHLVCLHGPEHIRLADGSEPQHVLAYAGASAQRAPLLVGGRPVPCAEVGQHAAKNLVGKPAATDGLTYAEITGEPDAAACQANDT